MSIETMGALISPPDIRDYRLSIKSQIEIPEEFELSMPPVKQQGIVGSCVAHSIALVMEYYNVKQHKQHIPMSVGYIYGNRVSTNYTGAGMYTKTAIKDVCTEGSVPYELFPYNKEVPKILEMVAEEKENLEPKAKPYRFTTYVKVTTEEEMKIALMNGYPIIFTINWYKGAKVKKGILTTNYKTKDGSHCMVIYGWNKDGWKFQNSWGILWGENGRAILPYDYKIKQAYSIIDELIGDIEIKKPFKTNNPIKKGIINIINKIIETFYHVFSLG